MKNIERKLLFELAKDSRRSDRELGKIIGVSQPTVSRLLKKMQKDYGLSFSVIPDLGKAGFEILAVTFNKREINPAEIIKAHALVEKFSNSIIYASTGIGSNLDANRMIISVHRNYADYMRFVEYLRKEFRGLATVGTYSFIVSLKSDKAMKYVSVQDLFGEAEK